MGVEGVRNFVSVSRTIISMKGEAYGSRSRFKKELLDELLAGHDAKTVFEQDGLLDELKKALAERILNAEMDHHLGQDGEQAAGNHRNGASSKTVLTDTGSSSCRFPATGRAGSSRR